MKMISIFNHEFSFFSKLSKSSTLFLEGNAKMELPGFQETFIFCISLKAKIMGQIGSGHQSGSRDLQKCVRSYPAHAQPEFSTQFRNFRHT